MDADDAERRVVLDRECAGDDALRAEVEELLGADGNTASDLVAVVADAVNAMVTRGDVQAAADQEALAEAGVAAGDTIDGRYTVTRVLGTGGMGVVVAAEHRGLAEQVAIKLLKPGSLATERDRLRFLREAKAAARIRSPHVVRVRDVGVLSSGTPFMVMDLLDGADLASILKARGRLPYAEACLITLQACEALAAAHARGVIHRDIKPGNLFLERAAHDELHVKLLDFGISKLTDREGEDEGPLTQSNDMVGSPAYMSPEQLRSPRDADARADVWSLGVVLYEMLAGARPFAGPSLAAVSMQILAEPPANLDADCPHSLRHVVSRCLEKDRAQRYLDVGELAVALAPLCGVEGHRGARRVLSTLGAVPDDDIGDRDEDVASFAETAAMPADAVAEAKRASAVSASVASAPVASASVARGNLLSSSPAGPIMSRAAWRALAVLVATAAIGTATWFVLRDDATGETESDPPETPSATHSASTPSTATPSATTSTPAVSVPALASSTAAANEGAASSQTHGPAPRPPTRPAPSIDPYGTRK
jgi:serine/threonine-protein kinase